MTQKYQTFNLDTLLQPIIINLLKILLLGKQKVKE